LVRLRHAMVAGPANAALVRSENLRARLKEDRATCGRSECILNATGGNNYVEQKAEVASCIGLPQVFGGRRDVPKRSAQCLQGFAFKVTGAQLQ